MVYLGKLYFLILLFSLASFTSCLQTTPVKSEIILLNKDTLWSDSLFMLYGQGRITYKQYEGFLIFTSDTIFYNPILIPKNSINIIQADILSSEDIKKLLKNDIEKIQYKLDLNSSQQLSFFLRLLREKYTLIVKSPGIEWLLKDSGQENVGKIVYNLSSLQLLIELYPKRRE